MIHRTHALLVASIACLSVQAASAQFTSDPAAPATLASGSNDQVQAKVVPIAAGGFYMSWYDNSAGGYDPYVQRFDASGNGQWGHGVRVLDTNFSSTEDYGLTMDAAGNAVIVTRSDVGGSLKIIAQAISPAGELLWGAGGVTLSSTTSVNSPKAGRAGDGAAVAGWTEGNRAKVMRLTPAGTAAWAAPATITDSTATTILSDLQPGDGDSVIASVVRYTSFSGAKTLQAQKFSGTGAALWVSTNVRVFATGSLQFGNFPSFLPDGEGGAIFTWYSTSPLQANVQWVSPTGALRFGTSGLGVTTTTEYERTAPSAAYDPATRRIYVTWTDHVANSSIYGAGAQCFDEAGQRLWGLGGLPIAPVETVYQYWQSKVAMLGGFPVFSWTRTTAFGSETAYAQSYAPDMTTRWAQATNLTGVASTSRMMLVSASGSPASAYAIYERGGTGNADIVGVRIREDGTLGPPASIPGDFDGDGHVLGSDLSVLLGAWGSAGNTDLTQDGNTDGADLAMLLSAWG